MHLKYDVLLYFAAAANCLFSNGTPIVMGTTERVPGSLLDVHRSIKSFLLKYLAHEGLNEESASKALESWTLMVPTSIWFVLQLKNVLTWKSAWKSA